MRLISPKGQSYFWIVVCCGLLSFVSPALAERLPIKNYTTADGLARDRVQRVRRDAKGFLWFCTAEGLSHFDGYTFTNYTVDHGLTHRSVWDFVETRDGVYWIATLGGLVRFNPLGTPNVRREFILENGRTREINRPANNVEPMFVIYRPAEILTQTYGALFEDRNGNVWWGTRNAVYRVQHVGNDWQFQPIATGEVVREYEVYNFLEDRQGQLWIATTSALFRRLPDGRVETFTTANGLPANTMRGLLEDTDGSIWVGTSNGLCQLAPDLSTAKNIVVQHFNVQDGLPFSWCNWLLRDVKGRFLVGTTLGLCEFLPQADATGKRFRVYQRVHGLNHDFIWSMLEDRDGNLWMGTQAGASKWARNGFTTWRKEDGMGSDLLVALSLTRDGEIIASGISDIGRYLVLIQNEEVINVKPLFTRKITDYGGDTHTNPWQDRAGEWWVPTANGLFRYPAVSEIRQLAHTKPKAVYTTREGLGHDYIQRLYEDWRGDLWIYTTYGSESPIRLNRWERATEKMHSYTVEDGLTAEDLSAFCEDQAGNLWIASYSGELLRYENGRFRRFKVTEGNYFRRIHSLFADKSGRLWVGTSEKGLLRIDHPGTEPLQTVAYTTADGLSSNDISGIAEDSYGNIWLATGRGLDRLNPATKQVWRYTTADGLASNVVHSLKTDRHGALWIGTMTGLSRFIPEPDPPTQEPPVFIRGLHVSGVLWPVSLVGQSQLAEVELAANQNQIQIDFFGLGLSAGESLQYEYKLEGLNRDWSPPISQRSINFSLTPGTYRFLVRAVTTDGTRSAQPAIVSFRILRPLWQRWWFILLMLAVIGSMIYFGQQYRLRRLIELERVRTRIATDLHDDIGASLSRMAILSEVVKQQNGHNTQSAQLLTEIADSARGLVDSMSDIVWSIDPRRDDLHHVVSRVRQYASDVLDAQGIAWRFTTPDELASIKLNPDQRRHLYLILKETINNTAKHAQCDTVSIALFVQGHQLTVEVSDNGKGFDLAKASETGQRRGGNGLKNLQARARELRGDMEIESAPGKGTRIILQVPL